MSENGKGCKPRPILIPKEEYEQKWEAVFGNVWVVKGYCDLCNKKKSWCECKTEKEVK